MRDRQAGGAGGARVGGGARLRQAGGRGGAAGRRPGGAPADRRRIIPLLAAALLSAAPLAAQDAASTAELLSGQELIYRGRFGAAQLYFERLAELYPADPAGFALQASALIWWGEARGEETFQADSIDLLLGDAIGRAQQAADSAPSDAARATALFWLGTAYGYRARQAELRGGYWRAARDAKAMQSALERALEADSACVDCLLGLAVYDYALARAPALARLVARIIGLGGGDAGRALDRMRRVSGDGVLARIEARWVYANALLREAERDVALREEARRLVGELTIEFPENAVFQRFLEPAGDR